MGTLLDKMNEVIQFLETIFPDQRIVTSFHAKQSIVALPEIRVYLEQINENGLLHWKVEFAPKSYMQLSDQISEVQTLRQAISTNSQFRYLPGKPDSSSKNWSEEIVQPWTPAGIIPQQFYLQATLLAQTDENLSYNSNVINKLDITNTPDQSSFPCFITHDSTAVFLGEATLDGSTLTTEYSPGQDFPSGSSIYFLEEEMIFTNAGTEEVSVNEQDNIRIYQTMDSHWKKVRLSPNQWEVQLQLPLLSNTEIDNWKIFNSSLQEISVAFFITSARDVYLSNPIAFDSINDPGGLTGTLKVTLNVSSLPQGGLP